VQVSFRTKITLLLLSMLTVMSNVAIITSLPHLKEHFLDIENIELYSKMMITLPSLSIAFLAPFLGLYLQKRSRKQSYMLALLLFSLFGTAGLYLQSIQSLLLSRLLLGTSIGTLMILTTSLVGDYFDGEQRHKYMGLQSAFVALGGLLFLLLGGIFSDIHWRYPFGIYILGLFLIPLVYFNILEPTLKHNISAHNDIAGCKSLFGIYFLAFAFMLIFFLLPTQMPFLMINKFGASGTLTASIIATAFVFNAVGAITFTHLKKRFEFRTIYMIGMSIVALGFIGIGYIQNVYLFFITSTVIGFGGGVLMTCITAWMLHHADPARRIQSSAYLTSSLFLGQFISPLLFFPLIRNVGIQDSFIALGIFLSTLIALFTLYYKAREQ